MTNYYEKIRTICRENFIGSVKCEDCEEDGVVEDELYPGEYYTCSNCKGKGYTIPFGKENHSIICNLNTFSKCDCNCSYAGKPLTHADVLRLLGSVEDDNGHETILEHYGNGDVGFYINSIKIDLTKDIKDQEPEVLEAIYDLVK